MKISIIENADQVDVRNATDKNGNAVQYFSQFGYVHLGGAFPEKMKIRIESPAFAYAVGDYTLDISSFKVGLYDALEIDQYNIKLTRIK